MTALLEKAVSVARALSPEQQDDIARIVLRLAAEEEAWPLSPDERAAIAASKAAAQRGEFASDDDLRALRARYNG